MLRRQVALVILAFVTTLNNAQLEQIQTTTMSSETTNNDDEITILTNRNGDLITTTSSTETELVNYHRKKNGTDDNELVRVVIIGSGMAGITAARHLADKTNFEIIVLEANTDRYGGRIWSYEAPGHPGQPVELGAMWIHGGVDPNHPLNKLVHQFGIATLEHDVGEAGEIDVYDLMGNKYNEENMKDIASVPQLLEELRQETVDRNLPDMNYDRAFRVLAQRNPRLFHQNRVRFFEIPGLESYQGSTKDQISLIYSEGIPNSTTADFHGHDVIIPTGYVRLIDLLITTGRPFHIEIGRLVTSIKCDDPTYPVQITSVDMKSKEKHIYSADHVIVTVPLGVLKQSQIQFFPPLPTTMLNAIDKIGFGNMVKVLLVYDEPFWPDTKYLGVESSDPTGLPLFFVNLYKINKLPALMASICSDGAVLADKLAENDLIKRVVEHLEIILGAEKVRKRNLVHTKVTRWRNDPLVRGAYSFGKLGMTSDDAYNIRKPIKPYIFFAGEHTSFPESYHGSVHGAHVSGVRAAREVMIERGLPVDSAAPRINWLGKLKTAAILSHLILFR